MNSTIRFVVSVKESMWGGYRGRWRYASDQMISFECGHKHETSADAENCAREELTTSSAYLIFPEEIAVA